jgi:pSer/pThr/pTyr-binding forkhead associated (FHA) protein
MKVNCGKCKAPVNLKIGESSKDVVFYTCPVCKARNRIKLKSNAAPIGEVAGWIVVHDENTKQQTHTLKRGVNVVGRKSVSKSCDVAIDTDDMTMSRNHFAVEVIHGPQGYNYIVYDVTSTNGTYINADENKKLNQNDKIHVFDGDTIQAGRTKMVLRIKKVAGNAKKATDTVINTGHLKTIIS